MVCRYPYEYTVLFMSFELPDMTRGFDGFAEILRTKDPPEDLYASLIPNIAGLTSFAQPLDIYD